MEEDINKTPQELYFVGAKNKRLNIFQKVFRILYLISIDREYALSINEIYDIGEKINYWNDSRKRYITKFQKIKAIRNLKSNNNNINNTAFQIKIKITNRRINKYYISIS